MMRLKLFLFVLLLAVLTAIALAGSPLWMRYPCVSPNGNQVAFEYQGDIFIVSIKGGTARQLTTHPARDIEPVWSPDGRMIAFSSNRWGNYDVYVVPAEGGTPRRLTFHSTQDHVNCWSPDGKYIYFTTFRFPDYNHTGFPSPVMTQLYKVDLQAHIPTPVIPYGVGKANISPNGKYFAYMDVKGYEDYWRKHHTSSVTRDIWIYNPSNGKYKMLTTFKGEDRDPVWKPDNNTIFYLSERSGSFNIWKIKISNPVHTVQITKHTVDPVRFLSISKDGKRLVYGFRGEIWTVKSNAKNDHKIPIRIANDVEQNNIIRKVVNRASNDMALSPDGKEIAFVYRGEVFVTSSKYSQTKRVTNTAEQERTVTWAPDGRTLYYASERGGSWNIYKSSIIRKEEKHFYDSTLLKEEPVVKTSKETFQPVCSPDGKMIAYLEERTTLKVKNLKTGEEKVLLPPDKLYSYSDGDINYSWSPDSKWIAVGYLPHHRWVTDIGIINVKTGKIHDVSQSGYYDGDPYWSKNGKMLLFISDRDGLRSHGGHGSQANVYAIFLTKSAYDEFMKPESEIADESPSPKPDKEKMMKKMHEKKAKKGNKEKKAVKPIKIEYQGITDRIVRLTINSSMGMVSALSPDGKTLVYFARSAGKFDLWVTDIKKHSTRILAKLNAPRPGFLVFSKDGRSVYASVMGRIRNINPKSGRAKPVPIISDINIKPGGERAYMFEHAWRQVLKKFYVKNLHHVNWEAYKAEYKKYLPYITNDADFAEMLSEMLGELNASHTGCRFRPRPTPSDDSTGVLGLFFDNSYHGKGLKIVEVLKDGPFDKAEAKIKPGEYLLAIDNTPVGNGKNYFPLLNHMAGKNMIAEIAETPEGKNSRQVVFKPISGYPAFNLLYKRWVERNRKMVNKLSGGKIGYVHIRAMNASSFKKTFSEIFGQEFDKEALIVDTRFNGGGWLHDDLCTMLSGKVYIRFRPRGQKLGHEPMDKWTRPVAVVVGESNYSDAYMFPFAFKELKLGKIIGMPVPGTGTAVWWERMINPNLIFGIPQVGSLDNRNHFLENQQLEPDIKVRNDPASMIAGRDKQLEVAVKELLKEAKNKHSID